MQIHGMGCSIHRSSGTEGQGIICLHKAPLQLLYSANMVPNLSVYEYGFSFQKAELQKGS